ncbi:phosphoenolpyruvate--protein phosphotransferase [Sphingomonas oleivorans]|uniref:phosphoenolpyruvate--protein phosphotransferase n=1 Tax=Sphingomonas oleivorans TaxID=1735121 RepID=A0A2T5FU67_9SPHN|nr:phosphoenolpyruvate--protein phosphotransferase [Sphingomonas oleivorans]PTQ07821.1 phosphoenolpyruvate--protein phosphotransferase [Sphingomonas oleivorans]
MTGIRLYAPIAGWAAALDEVPDPVFAERMMGDGIAIDPLDGVLRAPCDAEVVAVAPTGHSITLELANDAQLLLHIGLETVALNGRGFAALVAAGARVRTGDPLIRFDLDAVAAAARSLITPIVVANDGYVVRAIACNRIIASGEPLMEVHRAAAVVATAEPTGEAVTRRDVMIPMAHGLHARPAAKIAAALKPFTADIRFSVGGRAANARSTVAMLSLGLKHGDSVSISATGVDAQHAVTTIADMIETGMGEAQEEAQEPRPTIADAPPQSSAEGPRFKGVRAAPGLSVGPIVQFRPADAEVPEQGMGLTEETAILDAAIAAIGVELETTGGGEAASIAAAHRALLEDPELREAAADWLAQGKSAAFAWRAATRAHAEAIRATGNALLIERIADLLDVEQRLIARILGEEAPLIPVLPEGAILIADELLPSQFLLLDMSRLGGIVSARGGPTSHVAILAASAGVPMLVATGMDVLRLPEGRMAILDADSGTLDGDPEAGMLERATAQLRADTARREAEAARAHSDCVMADGRRIEIFANLASAADAVRAVEMGAEGCGLLRTEFLFLDRTEAPSEAEQAAAYGKIAAALEGRPLIVRTLDIGADKPVPYLPIHGEENPALGLRGVRLSLHRPELLAAQFRAILSAVPMHQCRIMVPMIVDRDELRAVRAIFDDAAKAMGISAKVPFGVMIETPSAALLADSIAAEADFLSIGTNDLTQYALAADRGNPALAAKIDPLHPAVLRLIAQTGIGAAAHGRWVGVCGGLASDPAAAPVLIGLGVTELSAPPSVIASLKAKVRTLRLEHCRAVAERALAAASADEVRALLKGDF